MKLRNNHLDEDESYLYFMKVKAITCYGKQYHVEYE